MKHPQRVDDYLEHIAEGIERATSYLQPLRDVEALEQNSQVQDAIVRNIEIIGEAAAHIYNREPNFQLSEGRFSRGRRPATRCRACVMRIKYVYTNQARLS